MNCLTLSITLALLAAAPEQRDVAISPDAEEAVALEEIQVVGVRQRLQQAGLLKDTIERTELLTAEQLAGRQANTLAEALTWSPGVWLSNECSMCGVKRLMLNGLRGEHTTILTDGIPSHTMLSGFYGVDAMPMAGVGRLEIARGAGASLIAPEAIGGTVNVVHVDPVQSMVDLDLALGEQDYQRGVAIGGWVSDVGTTRITATAQYDQREQFDGDRNGVSESPLLENESISFRISQDLGARDNVTARLAFTNSEIFGGPVIGDTTGSIGEALASVALGETGSAFGLFEGGDVRNRYTGFAWETTEWIETEREEAIFSWVRQASDQLGLKVAASYAQHDQDSFYEGIDYRADNQMIFLDARGTYDLSAAHVLTFGVDARREEMRSDSDALAGNPFYVSDSFDYDVTGVYLQNTWTPSTDLVVSAAVRFDQIEADFVDPAKPGIEIDESLVSPRVDARYDHNEFWTSRASIGRGYRAPLSFFETDHGILDLELGYLIDVDRLERSWSGSYSLSYVGDRLTATGSVTLTRVDDLASLEETVDGVPVLTQLRDESAEVAAADLSLGYQLTEWSTINFGFEHYDYDGVFEQSYAIAPIETRVTAGVDLHLGPVALVTNVAWLDGRNLETYGYEGFNQVTVDGLVAPESAKATRAPSWLILDARLSYTLGARTELYLGAYNLLDEVQTDDDTPLFFDADGGYDVAYIYGPARGRQFFAGVNIAF